MSKKIILILVLVSSIATTIFPQSSKKKVRDTIPAFIGISYIPKLNWKVSSINYDNGNFFKYKFYENSQSSVEGSYGISKIGLRFGFSANIENNFVGKIYRYGGYVSVRNYWLKMQNSKISGITYWSGPLPPSNPRFLSHFKFTNNYFNVEILRTSNLSKYSPFSQFSEIMGIYLGVGYTSMDLPVKISTFTTTGGKENQISGIPAYDTLFTAKFYTLCFGGDGLRGLLMTNGKKGAISGRPAMRFAMYCITQGKLGFGRSNISDYGVKMAEALNPGKTLVDSKTTSYLFQDFLSLGLRYYYNVKPVFLVFAVGYDLEGALIVNFGNNATTNSKLSYDTSFFYLYHGVSFKIYMSWIGNK
jgi:hypothetical protein